MHANIFGARTTVNTWHSFECVLTGSQFRCLATTSTSVPNHYETLGVGRSATAKQIKAAFYELSKKYHPDRHTKAEAKSSAAEKFQEVASAYEVLSSDEKRRAYDANFIRQPVSVVLSRMEGNRNRASSRKGPIGFDVDYKSFEHFQRSNRRRHVRHDYFHMPDEFYAEFGGRHFNSSYRRHWHEDTVSSNYRDERTAERESEERRLWTEVEEQKRKQAQMFPSLERMQEEHLKKTRIEDFKSTIKASIIVLIVSCVALLLQRK